MTDVTLEDWGVLAHPVRTDDPGPDAPPWKDNAYLAFWDPAQRLMGVVHSSTSPNGPGRRTRSSLVVGDASAEIVEEPEAGTLSTPSIQFDLAGRITVRGPDLEADLTLAPRGATADFTAGGVIPELVPGEPLRHAQRATSVTGTIAVRGHRATVDAVGIRDRTSGYRDESAAFPEYIAVIVDLGEEMLSVMKFAHADGGTKTDGFLMGRDGTVSARELTEIVRDASGLFAGAEYTLEDGTRAQLTVTERTGGFWVPMGHHRTGPAMAAYDEFVAFATDDGRRGHGMVEQGIVRRLT
jgi:hypothetical protein